MGRCDITDKNIMKRKFTSLMFLLTLLIFVGCERERPIVDFICQDQGEGRYYFENRTYWSDYKSHNYNAAWYVDGNQLFKLTGEQYFDDCYYTFKTSGNHIVELEIYDYDTERYYHKEKTIYVSLSNSSSGGGDTGGGGTDNTQYPTANFDYDFYDNFEIDFYNSSSNATSYSWSFGDGQSSTEEEPSHRYSRPGTYTVTLTARNSKGSHQATAQITITNPAYTYFLGITYTKVPQYNHNYKFVLTDDDIFTTTWGDSDWRTIYSTPFDYIYATPKLLNGLADDDYYELKIYMDTENSSGQIAKWSIPTTHLTQDYRTEMYGTSADGSTKVTIYFSYEKTPLSNSPARTEIKKAKQPITSEMTPAIK